MCRSAATRSKALEQPGRAAPNGPTESRSAFSKATVVGGDVTMLTTRRTALLLREVTPSEAKMGMSSSRHDGSAARETQHPRGRHVFAPTPYRNRLNKIQSAAKASAEFPTRSLQGRPLWKRRRPRPLLQALRNGHSKRSSSAFGWAGQRRFRWSSRRILVRIIDDMNAH
ncbi:hypothetical protein VTI28DRAFT_4473 [Corynascus sepedonium]